MPWYVIAIIAVIALSAFANIMNVGKPRDPVSPGLLVWILLFNGLFVWVLVDLSSRCS